jgi:hypothetical protein
MNKYLKKIEYLMTLRKAWLKGDKTALVRLCEVTKYDKARFESK